MAENDGVLPTSTDEQPVTASPEAEVGKEPQAVKYMTEEEVTKLLNSRMMSVSDKAAARIEQKINASLKALTNAISVSKSIGTVITPEQETALRRNAVVDALTEQDGTNSQATPGQENANEKDQLDPRTVTAIGTGYYQRANITLTPADPEWSLVNTTGSVQDYLDSIQESIRVYKDRTAKKPTAPAAATPSSAGKGGSVGVPDEKDYRAEMLAARGNPTEVMKIKAKYAKAGLDVDRVKFYQSN